MPTPAQVIRIAKLSAVYAAQSVNKGNAFTQKTDDLLPLMLNMEGAALEWKYEYDPTNTTDLIATSNYVYNLCRDYGLRAAAVLNA